MFISHIIAATVPDTPLNDAYHVGSFFRGSAMKHNEQDAAGAALTMPRPKQHQPPLTIAEQIANLKRLGLIVENESKAAAFLNDVSYYRFIKAYSLKLKPKNGNYYEGTTFHQIAELYLFNADLRQLLFPQIERVEINLRCRLSNYFCLRYGILGYLDPSNFKEYPAEFSEEIQKEIQRNHRNPFVCNFQKNYEGGTIPFYALVELISFGTLSKFFKNMKNFDKKKVSSFYGVPFPYFESWIENISYVRNICAHYGRIYNAKFPKKALLFKCYSQIGIPNDQLMGTLICVKQLLPQDAQWVKLVEAMELLLEKYPCVEKQALGFPAEWKEILLAQRA